MFPISCQHQTLGFIFRLWIARKQEVTRWCCVLLIAIGDRFVANSNINCAAVYEPGDIGFQAGGNDIWGSWTERKKILCLNLLLQVCNPGHIVFLQQIHIDLINKCECVHVEKKASWFISLQMLMTMDKNRCTCMSYMSMCISKIHKSSESHLAIVFIWNCSIWHVHAEGFHILPSMFILFIPWKSGKVP